MRSRLLTDPGTDVSDFIHSEKVLLPSGAILYRNGNKRALEIGRIYGRDPSVRDLYASALRMAETHIAQMEDNCARIDSACGKG